jgi:hypothetical protein
MGAIVADFSRRAVLAGGVALLGAAIVRSPGSSLLANPLPAKTFFDSVGICTHPCWRDTAWGSSDWMSRLIQTGVKNTRGEVAHGWAGLGALRDLRRVFADGVKICALIPGHALDRAAAAADLAFLADEVGAENLSGIESVNEYDSPNRRPPDWPTKLRDFHKWLYETVRTNSKLDGVPVVAPSIWCQIRADYAALGNLEPTIDRGCAHYYTDGRRPTLSAVFHGGEQPLSDAIRDARIIAPTRPLYITEFGYRVPALGRLPARGMVSQAVQAKYLLRGLFDLFRNGVEKTFIYELMDDRGTGEYWGLTDSALEPRRSFYALRNLVELFRDSGTGFPVKSGHRLANVPSSVHPLTFYHSDGTTLLVMYQDVDSLDRSTGREINVLPKDIELSFEQPAARVEVFEPVFSDQPVKTVVGTRRLTISVADHVTIVRIAPPATA